MSVRACLDRLTARKLHNALALVCILPLTLSVLTGLLYRISRNVFLVEKSSVVWLMRVHTLRIVGLHSVWPLLLAVLTVLLILSALPLTAIGTAVRSVLSLCRKKASQYRSAPIVLSAPSGASTLAVCCCGRRLASMLPAACNSRAVHRWLGLALALPLGTSAVTGAAYTWLVEWRGADQEETAKYWMRLHQGSYLGPSQLYVAILGTMMLIQLGTGSRMITLVRRWLQLSGASTALAYAGVRKSARPAQNEADYALVNVQRAFGQEPSTGSGGAFGAQDDGLTTEEELELAQVRGSSDEEEAEL